MKIFRSLFICLILLTVLLAFVGISYATNGYFANGYSVKNKALAGAGTALPLDSLAAATNPAGMVWVGSRADISLTLFNPNREYTVTGPANDIMGQTGPFSLTAGTIESDKKWFVIPSLGYNRMMSDDYSIGISIYGNGGMNTDYDKATYFDKNPGTTPTGVNLEQLFVVPTYARKLNDKHSIGISPIFAYQRFKSEGLDFFDIPQASTSPTNVTNNNHENSYGFGGKIGYLGEVMQDLYFGAMYQTKIYMSELDKYAGLFAEQGDFDIPANWSAGLAYHATSVLILALDVQQILYSDVKSIANPMNPANTALLGADSGNGFGWKDITIVKVGVQWESNPGMIWRAGYSYGEQPIPSSEVLFNIIAPGVIEHHASVGLTKEIGSKQEVNIAVVRAFSNDVEGPNPLDPSQTIKLTMNQWEYTAGYSWKF
jgi:long-chain fatty acid transport protein